jgi:ech hydrogenase subunit E
MAKTIIPFGPQHPVLPEPIHLTLVCEDDRIQEVLPSIGYCHRGIEKAAEKNHYHKNPFLVERVCGICNFMHSMCYCQAVEKMMKIEVPGRGRYLRVIWSELNRLRSHLLWMGLLADAIGMESLFMQFWRIRERVIDLIEKTTGARIIFSTNQIGGLRRDITPELLKEIRAGIDIVRGECDELGKVLLNDYSLKARAVGKGVLSKEKANELGAVGPTARASGIKQDMRTLGYAAYGELDFTPIVEEAGDSYARALVRFKECVVSVELIHQAILKIPSGPISAAEEGWPTGEAIDRVEQPRGEVIYFLKGNGTANLERMKIRTPTFANIPALLHMLPGCELADVPVIVLSIDPCVSCTER